jgi:peptidoglycan/LPS O-acetylase OafA/YrhL
MDPAAAGAARRLNSLQILRFVAAALVLHAHAVDAAQRIRPGATAWLAHGTLGDIGAIGVDIFFVISGFIITRTAFPTARPPQDPVGFARARLLRVVPLCWLMTLPWLIGANDAAHSYASLATSLTFWPVWGGRFVEPIHPLAWTLCFEMLFYAAFCALLARPGRRTLVALLGLFAGSWAASGATGSAVFGFLGNPIIVEFLAGVGLALALPRLAWGRSAGFAALFLAAAWVTALLVVGYGEVSESIFTQSGELALRRVFLFGVPSVFLVAGAVLMEGALVRSPTARLLGRAGDASYALYLAHPGALAFLVAWSPALPADGLVVLGISLGLMAGALVHAGIERPLALALTDLGRRRRARAAAPEAG